jgi:4'-phosphopantetheinyl transferase
MAIPDPDPMTHADMPSPPELLHWDPAEEISPLGRDRTHAWIVELDSPSHDQATDSFDPADPQFACLSPEEVARAVRFIRPRDRLRFARCRSALRHILGSLLALPDDCLSFRTIGAGKPELDPSSTDQSPHAASELRFNVSHSGNLGLIAASQGRELGVDIEQIRPIKEAERIVASYFSASEQVAFAAIPADLKDRAFHRGWTRKEAIIKADGTGLAGLATTFETHFGPNEIPDRFMPTRPFPRINRWHLWEVSPSPGFVAALALDSSRFSPQ